LPFTDEVLPQGFIVRNNELPEIQTPCILVCAIDLKTGFCFGCGRTRTEIASWSGYSDAQRSTIMAELADRMAMIERKPRRITRRRAMTARKVAGISEGESR
jgi:uncharacterized protein